MSTAAIGRNRGSAGTPRLLAALALAAVAFGGAFAIGRATAGSEEPSSAVAPAAAEQVEVPSGSSEPTRLKSVGSLPSLREPPPSPAASEESTPPSTEAPTAVVPEPVPEAAPVTPEPVPQEPVPQPPPEQPPPGGGDG